MPTTTRPLGIAAQVEQLQAEIDVAGGLAEVPALFDLAGNLVPAKILEVRKGPPWLRGQRWGVLNPDDHRAEPVKWLPVNPASPATLERHGYREGRVRARVRAFAQPVQGGHRAIVVRLDGGYSPDVQVIDNGLNREG